MATGSFSMDSEGDGVEAVWCPNNGYGGAEGLDYLHLFAGPHSVIIKGLSPLDMDRLGEQFFNAADAKRAHDAKSALMDAVAEQLAEPAPF